MTYPPIRRGGLTSALRAHYSPAPPSRLDGHADIEMLRGVPAKIVDLRNRFRDERGVRQREVMANASRLSAQGLTEATAQAYADVGAQYQTELDRLQAAAQTAAQAIHDDEHDARPEPDGTLEGIQLRVGMRGDAERLNTAGIALSPTQVNEAQDVERLFSIMDALPVVLRIGGVDGPMVDIHMAHAERRLHELGGDVRAYDAAREAEELIAELDGTFAAARGEFGDARPGGRRITLQGAVANEYARQVVKARNQAALNMRVGEGWVGP